MPKPVPATPAVLALRRAGVAFELRPYTHDPTVRSYGAQAAAALGVAPQRVLKTLMVLVDGTPTVAVVPVSGALDLKALAAVLGAKRAELADVTAAQRLTGYVVGGISPLGQRRALPTVVDDSALRHGTVLVSAGRRGLDVELAPDDLVALTAAITAAIARPTDPNDQPTDQPSVGSG